MTFSFPAAALCLAAALASAAPPERLEVRVLSAVGDAVPDPGEKRVREGTGVTLSVAVRSSRLGLVSASPRLVWESGTRPRVARAPGAAGEEAWRVRWFRVEVASRALSNTEPSFHWEPIDYREVPIPACDDEWTCPAEVRATILGDRGGLGTMAFKVEASVGGASGASVGAETRFRGGLSDRVARVTVRRDDSYLGHLTELFNTPYIWGSAGTPDSVHQAERRIGSDCADFVTYGVRRLGHPVPYTSTWELPRHARVLFASPGADSQGRYLDKAGRPIPVGAGGTAPGDLLLFPGHVGALVADREPLGVLSTSDVMIHTCWAEPTEEPITETSYGTVPVRVLRWKALER